MISVGDIISTSGVFSTPERYHEYTGAFQYQRGKAVTEFREFSFSHF